ncbi:hypothetical protein IEQ34_011683 [Dendrobium chrysotoxum]|uniref:Uncharacterized protein n=1 Tax=Dendrobium chrysotoxum TaxID=161865 RepID=A0AAV7GTJ9_DENCH|nr:hypothetical protein IEQ34_011683 [Dendrobium chrysotoxum]
MEGVGARLGRSSARYAPTTVFSGPVRRWKKKWVPLSNPNNSNSNNNNHSHLLLFKWTPINTLSNGTAAATPPASSKDATSADATPPSASEEAPRRKFRYIPVSILEQKQEVNVKSDDESKPDDVGTSLQPAQGNGSDGNTEGSDVLMEEAQASEKEQSQSENAKETNLDLSLGLKAHDDDHENDPRAAVGNFDQPEKLSSVDGTRIKPSANSESESRKRKSSATNLEMSM